MNHHKSLTQVQIVPIILNTFSHSRIHANNKHTSRICLYIFLYIYTRLWRTRPIHIRAYDDTYSTSVRTYVYILLSERMFYSGSCLWRSGCIGGVFCCVHTYIRIRTHINNKQFTKSVRIGKNGALTVTHFHKQHTWHDTKTSVVGNMQPRSPTPSARRSTRFWWTERTMNILKYIHKYNKT